MAEQHSVAMAPSSKVETNIVIVMIEAFGIALLVFIGGFLTGYNLRETIEKHKRA